VYGTTIAAANIQGLPLIVELTFGERGGGWGGISQRIKVPEGSS